ncbi:MAG: Mur ligase family protein, partial [Vicinamibacterales bacterium]
MTLDPLDWLLGLEPLGMKFGLANMERLMTALDHPERSFTSIHIAGTNGKGSVTAMVDTALRAAGVRSARYTSPHLLRLEERFVIDGAEVTTTALRRTLDQVRSVVEQVQLGDHTFSPTFFECTTAAAFELFRRHGAAIAVLEVGLGGRLDATNVIMPTVTAITSIDFDHQALLGTTLQSIAAEKAGII